ncbi:hypothetical protein E2562_032455 [Oryza meyeriana var. granulata]|uniref:Uncharacterized protein n=1 Tax=Oryza meyeriana var. granulata TaxID=110450 RepID=A0A6G1FER0_9ORYZ|nr:hypothetical protein E2562_032455 [Oryza meyeriana var. granulata]
MRCHGGGGVVVVREYIVFYPPSTTSFQSRRLASSDAKTCPAHKHSRIDEDGFAAHSPVFHIHTLLSISRPRERCV